jgi:hypothetical protein
MSSVEGGHAIDPTPVSPSHLSPPHHKIEVKLSFRRTSLEGLSLSHLSPVPSASQKRGGD